MSIDINVFAFAFVVLFSLLKVNAQSIISGNASYIGGIPLRTPDSCPAGSVAGQVTFEKNCCGAGQTFVKVEGSVCCETSSDCYSEVIAAPKCADSSWQLCGTNQGGFCCEEDWVCYTQTASGTIGGGVGCSTPGATLSAGQSEVTTVYAANEGPDASTTAAPSSSSTTPSSTPETISTSSTVSSTATTSSSQATATVVSQAAVTTISLTGTGPTSLAASISSSAGSNEGSPSVSTTAKKGSSLSGGPIAGIIIVAIVLLAAAFIGGVWFSRRKRGPDPSPSERSTLEESKISDGVQKRYTGRLEAHVPGKGHSVVYEIGNGYTPRSELPANHMVAELDAGYTR